MDKKIFFPDLLCSIVNTLSHEASLQNEKWMQHLRILNEAFLVAKKTSSNMIFEDNNSFD
jgi:hypothetical protein